MTARRSLALAAAAALFVAPALLAEEPYTLNVAVVLYDGVEILDFAGPAEVLAVAAGYGRFAGEPAFHVYTVSKSREPIVSQGFIDVVPDHSIADAPAPDVVVLPGGSSSAVTGDPEFMAWVESAAGGADAVLTVCTGAFIAGQAGLLDGAEATTWYDAVSRLAERYPEATVHRGRRFVDNGKLITTAGVSAGIDGALHFVARNLGRYVADRTAEYMEYRWTPEAYQSAAYAHLNPRLDARGRALQQAEIDLREGSPERAEATLRRLVEADPDDGAAWLALGTTLHTAGRYEAALEANRHAAESPRERATALYNMACEHALLGDRERALEAAARAIDAGFRSKRTYLNDPDLASLRDDARFRELIDAL